MYLKRLELHGFKTFASRTVLDFEAGVTAVVGPNGSGKSNLADAVRWALGESNMRNVRCRTAEDLIFAGANGRGARSATRPPMGMAEVMLTFDNHDGWLPVDFREVRIGRRAYRAGENEYLLNGARVRLRDIADMLSRTGIGGGHLVIGQGLIDTVLSQRPEERRTIVETLAGLRFYYSRREDAETRLITTETNLRNVDAMIAEAAPHLALLREQNATYHRHHAVERELRDLLLLHYAHAHALAVTRRAQRSADLTAAQTTVVQITTAIHEAERDATALRARSRLLVSEAEALRVEARTTFQAREEAERALAVGQVRREAAGVRLEDIRGGLPEVEARHADAAAELARAIETARALEAERDALVEERRPLDEAIAAATSGADGAERALRALGERRRILERQEAAAGAELAALGREEAAAGDETPRLLADEQVTARALHEAAAAHRTAGARLSDAEAEVEAARSAASPAESRAAAAIEQARIAVAELRAAERHADELRARGAGLRSWLRAAGGGREAAPVSGALVTAAELERALAAGLGSILAAHPVPNDAPACDVAALLDGGVRTVLTGGRASLDATAQARLQQALMAAGLPPSSIVGWGNRVACIQADDRLARPLRDALSLVLVIRDLQAALQAHALLSGRVEPAGRLVIFATLDGELVAPSGLVQRYGGEGASALARARELREVEASVVEAEGAINRADSLARETDQASRLLTASAAAAEQALRAAEAERAARRADLTSAERAVDQARRDAEGAARRLQRSANATAEHAGRRAEWTVHRDELRASLAGLEEEEASTTDRQRVGQTALRQASVRHTEHAAALALVCERLAGVGQRRDAAEAILRQMANDLKARRDALARLEAESRSIDTYDASLASRLTDAENRLQAIHMRLRPLEHEMTALDERVASQEARLTELRPAGERAAEAHEAAALALQRADHEIESIAAGLQAELGRDPVDLPAPAALPAGLPSRVKALRAQLAAFGPVNARAPEDLSVAAERQEFLQAQAADLREGIARLRGLIAAANATVRERFSAVAAELDAQFRLYLQRLFGGGQGEVTALYDEAGLPSGLEISAQPPGKRTRELALLSGGERALVGLALIFAMLEVRPVPFCVLDEAEAALDEVNTLRVGEILRALSVRTQMLVITHNRGTMSHADALYGVTMADGGVSLIAGLRLDDVEAVRRSRAG